MARRKSGIKNKAERDTITDGLEAIITKRRGNSVEVRKRRARGTADEPPGSKELTTGVQQTVTKRDGRQVESVDIQAPDLSKVAALATHGMELEHTGTINLQQQRARAYRAYRGLYASEIAMGIPGLADESVAKNADDLDADFIDLINGTSTLARRIEAVAGAMPKALARGDINDFLECLYYIEHPEELEEEEKTEGEDPDGEGDGDEGDSEGEGTDIRGGSDRSKGKAPPGKAPAAGSKPELGGEQMGGKGAESTSKKPKERKDPPKEWKHEVFDTAAEATGFKLGGGGGSWSAASITVNRAESFDPDARVLGQVPHYRTVIKGRPGFKINLHRHAQGVLQEQETIRTQRLDSTGDVSDITWEVNVGNLRSFERPAKNSAKLVIAVDMSGSMGCWCGRTNYGRDYESGELNVLSGTLAMQVQAALSEKFPDAYVFGFSAGHMTVGSRSGPVNMMYEMQPGYRPYCNHAVSHTWRREVTAEEDYETAAGWVPYSSGFVSEYETMKTVNDSRDTDRWLEEALGHGNPDCAALQHIAEMLNGQFENAFAVIISDGAPAGLATHAPPGTPKEKNIGRILCSGPTAYTGFDSVDGGHSKGMITHTKELAHSMYSAGMRFQSVLIQKDVDDIYPAERKTHVNSTQDIQKLGEVMSSLQESMA